MVISAWVFLGIMQLVPHRAAVTSSTAAPGLHHPIHVDHQAPDRLGLAQLVHELLADGKPLCGAVAARVGGRAAGDRFERQGRQIALQPVGEQIELLLLPLLELLADEHRAFGECKVGETARPVQDRGQGFAPVDRVFARESHFARELDHARLDPLRNGLDDQRIVRLQRNVRRGVSAPDGRKVLRDELGLARTAVADFVAGDLRLGAIGRIPTRGCRRRGSGR